MFNSPFRQQGVDRFTTSDMVPRTEGVSTYFALQFFDEYAPISASAALAITGSGAVTGTGSIGGSSTITFSSSSSVSGLGLIVGSAAAVFSNTSTTSGEGGLNGSVSYTITGTGDLGTQVREMPIEAAVGYTITASGQIAGIAGLSADNGYTINASSGINAKGDMIGTASIEITGSLRKRVKPRQITVKTKYWL